MGIEMPSPRQPWNIGGEGKGVEGENDLTHPLSQIPGYATVITSVVYKID